MTIYVDMDGVLAKWDTTTSAEGTKAPGYFLERDKEEVVINLINSLLALGTHVCILSAVWNEACARDKSVWLDNIFGKDLERIFVPYGNNKADYILGGKSVLIDDYTKNLDAWRDSGNIPVKFYNDINGTKGTYQGAYITKDMQVGEMLSRIADAVQMAA